MKKESEQQVARLREEKARLIKEFEDKKYSGEAKTSRFISFPISILMLNDLTL